MEEKTLNELLKKPKEFVDQPDAIVDVYDLTFVWASQKLTKAMGYAHSEMQGLQTIDIHSDDKEQARKTEMEISVGPQGQVREMPVKTKQGKPLKVKFKVYRFEFQENPYMVGKLLSVKD